MTLEQWRLVWIVAGIALVGFAVVSYQSGRHAGIIADWLAGRWKPPEAGPSIVGTSTATGIWTPLGRTAGSVFSEFPNPHNWITAGFPGQNPDLKFRGFTYSTAPKYWN